MGMAVSETPRHKLRQYSAGTDPHPTRTTFNGEMSKLEELPALKQGSTGSRPVSGVGKVLYWDEAVKRFVYDDGTEWNDVAPIGGVTPTGVAIAGAASEGTSPRAARGDHTHPLPLATAAAHGAMPREDKAKLDGAAALDSPDAVNTLVKRNGVGATQLKRLNIVDPPTAVDHATRKDYVDNGLAGKSGIGHAHVAATTTAPGFMSAEDKAKLDGATSTSSNGTVVMRSATGAVGIKTVVIDDAPAADSHATRKDYVDIEVGKRALTGHTHAAATASAPGFMSAADKSKLDGATAATTPSKIVMRDATGSIHAGPGADAWHAVRKDYVDAETAKRALTDHSHAAATSGAAGFMSAADKTKLDVIPTIGAWTTLGAEPGQSASSYTPEYRTNSGRIELRGAVVKGATGIVLTNGFTVSLRPMQAYGIQLVYAADLTTAPIGGGIVRGAVSPGGAIQLVTSSSVPEGAVVYLDGISWAVDA